MGDNADSTQLSFLSLLMPEDKEIEIQISELDDGNWIATMEGGWWMAIAGTREAAIKAVQERYQNERTYFD